MATFRHELAQYNTVELLVSTIKVPTNNDQVIVESLNRTFNWLEGSTAAADNVYIIEQTSESTNGRWVASTAAGAVTFIGTALSDPMGNGELSVFEVPLTNGNMVLSKDSGAAIGITNGDTIPDGVIISSITMKDDNLAKVVLTNQTGNDIPPVSVSLKAIDFTGVVDPSDNSIVSLSTSTSIGFGNVDSSIASLSTSTSTAISSLVLIGGQTDLTPVNSSVASLSTSTSTGLSAVDSSVSLLSTSTSTGLSTVDSSIASLSTSTSTSLSNTNSDVASLSTSTSTNLSTVDSAVLYLSTSTSTAISSLILSSGQTDLAPINSAVASLSTSTSTSLSNTDSTVALLSTSIGDTSVDFVAQYTAAKL